MEATTKKLAGSSRYAAVSFFKQLTDFGSSSDLNLMYQKVSRRSLILSHHI